MRKIKTSLIVAMAENRCIGLDNKMPWHISEDLKRFKTLTMGHPVIMGRKTFESILGYLKKPLPGRDSFVISRSGYTTEHDAHICENLENAISAAQKIAGENGLEEIFIIGGAQIYTQAIHAADCLHLTQVHKTVDGDAFFPEFDKKQWFETDRIDSEENGIPYSFITLERQ